jgi:hypothetical protein
VSHLLLLRILSGSSHQFLGQHSVQYFSTNTHFIHTEVWTHSLEVENRPMAYILEGYEKEENLYHSHQFKGILRSHFLEISWIENVSSIIYVLQHFLHSIHWTERLGWNCWKKVFCTHKDIKHITIISTMKTSIEFEHNTYYFTVGEMNS